MQRKLWLFSCFILIKLGASSYIIYKIFTVGTVGKYSKVPYWENKFAKNELNIVLRLPFQLHFNFTKSYMKITLHNTKIVIS